MGRLLIGRTDLFGLDGLYELFHRQLQALDRILLLEDDLFKLLDLNFLMTQLDFKIRKALVVHVNSLSLVFLDRRSREA